MEEKSRRRRQEARSIALWKEIVPLTTTLVQAGQSFWHCLAVDFLDLLAALLVATFFSDSDECTLSSSSTTLTSPTYIIIYRHAHTHHLYKTPNHATGRRKPGGGISSISSGRQCGRTRGRRDRLPDAGQQRERQGKGHQQQWRWGWGRRVSDVTCV